MLLNQPMVQVRGQHDYAAELPEFCFNPSRAQRLLVGQRLVVNVPANVFRYASGETVTKPVRLQIGMLEDLVGLLLAGMPTLFQDHLFNCWGQFLVQAWQGQEMILWHEPLPVQWLPAGRLLSQPLQLLHAANERGRDSGTPQWRVQPPSRLRVERSAGQTELQLQVTAPGYWMIGTARIGQVDTGLFSLRPQGMLPDGPSPRAVLLFDRYQAFAELQATPRGFTGWRLPAQHAGHALVWGRMQDQWIGGVADFNIGRDKVVPVNVPPEPAYPDPVQLFQALLPGLFS
ncbi:MAG: hypothetical protein KDC54_14770, partial [Lewinella sp.]|nr:hypothetical protein [Lewinella sp.]